MSEKFYLTQDDIEVISEAVELLRSADFNAIHDNLGILSGINAQGQDIKLKELYQGVMALNDVIQERGKQVENAAKNTNVQDPLTRYSARLNGDDGARVKMGKLVTRMWLRSQGGNIRLM